jgi:hypothetical protein
VDVEEEGLFSGQYPRQAPGVANVARLERLAFVSREFGIPLTLLPTYPVVRDSAAAGVLRHFQEDLGAEIGAHLHPWNTPPFMDLGEPEPVPAARLPRSLLAEKLAHLADAVASVAGIRPRSFRMGRFDLDADLFPLLAEQGFAVDGSLVPLRVKRGGPDHLLAPAEPFVTAGADLVEAPLTVVPVWARAPEAVSGLGRWLPQFWAARLRENFRFVLAVGIQPTMFSLPAMRLAARLHRRRGGRTLHLFLHSSELLPGANPQFPSEAAVDRLVGRIRAFLSWLRKTGFIRGLTLSALAQEVRQEAGKKLA